MEKGEKVAKLGNILGTHWELEGNIVQTHWEARKNEKKSPLHPQNIKGKKARHLECMLGPSHWLHEFFFPKDLVTIFGLGSHPLQRTPYLFSVGATFDF